MEATLTGYAKKMIIVIIATSFLIIIGIAIVFRNYFAVEFGLGVVMAGILNICKVLMLKHAVARASSMESGVGGYTGLMYFARFLLTGLVLVAAHFIPFVEFLGAVLGLLSMPVASYALKFFIKDKDGDTITEEEVE